MKLVTYQIRGNENLKLGVLSDHSTIIDIQYAASHFGILGSFASVVDVLTDPEGLSCVQKVVDAALEIDGRWILDIENVHLKAPIPRPGKILGVALNYYDFCERGNLNIPTELKVFTKLATTVVGPEDIVQVPAERKVTYEGELGVVIGKRGKHIAASNALDYVAGYTIVNDFTANDLVKEDIQLMRGKNLDTFCPIGPTLVTKDEIEDPNQLTIQTKVNNQFLQNSNTSQLIFKIPEIIAYFSSFLTLEPGDIIASGTPAGTALQYHPPAFMKQNDLVSVTVEGLGTLSNRIMTASI